MTADPDRTRELDGEPVTDPFDAHDLEIAVSNVTTTVDLLGESTTEAELADLTWEDLALLLKRLRVARHDLAVYESALERAIAGQWKEAGIRHDQPVMGVGVVKVNRSRPRKGWQHEAVLGAVLDRHLTENQTGELPTPWEVRDWIMAAGHIDYWRVKALRDLGLDPDDYSTPAGPSAPTVTIV